MHVDCMTSQKLIRLPGRGAGGSEGAAAAALGAGPGAPRALRGEEETVRCAAAVPRVARGGGCPP